MSAPQGKFAWYELMTTDTQAAGKFYSSVVGWSTKDVGMPGMPYTTFNVGEVGIAGMLATTPDAAAAGVPPSWIGYIVVDDADAYAAKIVAAGGRLCKEPTDVPGMLRFAVVTDPQGAPFVVFHSFPGMTSPPNRPMPPDVGTVPWHELYTSDLEPAWDSPSGKETELLASSMMVTNNPNPASDYCEVSVEAITAPNPVL